MNSENKKKGISPKKENGKVKSKTIKHDPSAESARAKFGLHTDDYREEE